MTSRRPAFAATGTAIALAILLSGCGSKKKDVDALDRELVGNASGDQTDPALTSALQDQIMVDPSLAQQKDGARRPGGTPGQSPIPATGPGGGGAGGPALGEVAQSQAAGKASANGACYRSLQYSVGWAQKLPAAVPLYPDAQVSEAAGSQAAGCDVRVVSFVSAAPADRVAGFYETSARRAGFAAERQGGGAERVVAGDKGSAAFYATVRERAGGGSEVDLVFNAGR